MRERLLNLTRRQLLRAAAGVTAIGLWPRGLSLAADEPTKKAPPAPTPLMCKQGEVLLEDQFGGGAYAKDWFRITGQFDVENDALRCAELAADNHHSELSTGSIGPLKSSELVVQFSFKLDGATMLAVGIENPQGHVARAIATPDGFQIMKWAGKSDVRKLRFAPGSWHTVLWEIQGTEMVAQLDDQPLLYVDDPGLKIEKTRLVLINLGQTAWFDDVRVWKAEPNDRWPEQRKKLKGQGLVR